MLDPSSHPEPAGRFDPHAVTIAKRQYFQPGDNDLEGMFRRVANWVAQPERSEVRELTTERFYDLMISKRFCPGGRVLAGADTMHGNVLNCFVQDGGPEAAGSTNWVLNLATKLALVTKVGGGNGVNLDPLTPKRQFDGRAGRLYLTIDPNHSDYAKVRDGTFLDLVQGDYVTRGYRSARFVEKSEAPSGIRLRRVGDSVDDIWRSAGDAVKLLLEGHDVLVDLSDLRAEGIPVAGSGGTSSGPSSFSVEVFDNFGIWAGLGGAEYAGPVATLRYVCAPTLRAIRQGGTRRGAGMATISIAHPDLADFITAKDLQREQAEGDISTFNISVLVTDEFMESAKHERQGPLWEIAQHAWATGEPGLIYIDRINEHNPMRAELGDILSTNPCVTADTAILTADGPRSIGELAQAGDDVLVWAVDPRTREKQLRMMRNPRKTRTSNPILAVTFDSGLVLRCTPDHSLFTVTGEKVQAQSLNVGDSVLAYADVPVATTVIPTTLEDQQAAQLVNHKVMSVEPSGSADVYNATVDGLHTYLIPDADGLGGIVSANCGEIPLYPGEPCDLGALNLAAYVTKRGRGLAGYDFDGFAADTTTAVRFLDNVLDVNKFALEDNREMSMKLRRLGLGVMGLADALILMGYAYDSDEGRDAVEAMIGALRNAASAASEQLAAERGVFPLFDQSDLATPRRNVAVLTVAPTGTTSMLMGVSSGVEPVFAPFIYRKIGTDYHALIHPLFQELLEEHPAPSDFYKDGGWDWHKVVAEVQVNHGSVQGLSFIPEAVSSVLRCAHDISPADHVKMQGAVQRAFDGGEKVANSISKTINLPNQAIVDDVYEAYSLAFSTGCKGITVYRDGSRDFQVLSTSAAGAKSASDSSAGEQQPVQAPSGGASAPVAASSVPNGAPGHTVPAPVASSGVGVAAVAAGSLGAPTHASVAAAATARGPGERLPGEPLFDRPIRLSGFTDKVKLMLPSGERRGFFVTVNKQDELPTEVFITSGKAGDEANADSEALGRVVSIALQYGVPAEALIKTLRGINGGMYGTYHGRLVASKADLLAVALETAGVENVLNRGVGCPDCGAPLRFEEGCQTCASCGYSKCG